MLPINVNVVLVTVVTYIILFTPTVRQGSSGASGLDFSLNESGTLPALISWFSSLVFRWIATGISVASTICPPLGSNPASQGN